MSDKLRATVDHIDDTGRAFQQEAVDLGRTAHLASPPTPGVGDVALSSALLRLSDAFGAAHRMMTGLIDGHGSKLRKAAADYQNTDIDLHGMFDDLIDKYKGR
ncbi:DUF6317 family protein [Streptomyces sp. ET3-23]|uniref:DUF6317 family protein n=1 Tax=Streptomyces sp. ET3-23 TaxID=2885643 RepID=UPI001D126D22|nr:DUF6317 family protein [Streptomyces sp. ET3-23]MCC2275782.1 DUF6317 family protein [Streptomyces sp. ET3-23]